MTPPGTHAVIFISADGSTSWGARGIDAWYCGQSTDHYQNCILFIPYIGSYRISCSFDLFPQHCLLTEFTSIQHTLEVLAELTESVQQLNQQSRKTIKKNWSSHYQPLKDHSPRTEGGNLHHFRGWTSTSEGGPNGSTNNKNNKSNRANNNEIKTAHSPPEDQ